MQKVRAFFDSKLTWLTIGSITGAAFGESVAQTVGLLGQLVMAVL